MEDCNIANYVDDNASHLSGKSVDKVLNNLEIFSSSLFQYFTDNRLKENAGRCHLLLSSGQHMHVNIVTLQIKNSSSHRLFGVDMDCQLSFGNHINPICTDLRAKTKAREMKLFIEDFFSKSDQFRRKLLIWSHLLKKSLMENLIFCAYLSELKNPKTTDY